MKQRKHIYTVPGSSCTRGIFLNETTLCVQALGSPDQELLAFWGGDGGGEMALSDIFSFMELRCIFKTVETEMPYHGDLPEKTACQQFMFGTTQNPTLFWKPVIMKSELDKPNKIL